MRKLSIIFALTIAFFTGSKAYAQEGLSFGVKAGVNLSNFYGSNYTDELDSKLGFQIGLTAEYGITNNLFLGSGLEFTTKGSRFVMDIGSIEHKTVTTPMYLQLPIHIGYKFEVANGINLLAEAGPYVAFGIGGKSKLTISGNDDPTKDDFFGSEDDGGAKRFDFGVGGAIGAEFGQIVVKIGSDLGLVNMNRSDLKLLETKTLNLFLTVGFKF